MLTKLVMHRVLELLGYSLNTSGDIHGLPVVTRAVSAVSSYNDNDEEEQEDGSDIDEYRNGESKTLDVCSDGGSQDDQAEERLECGDLDLDLQSSDDSLFDSDM